MAREVSKQKPAGKNSFDDELGDDFLSSWKPSKSLAALDFEDDEPVAKNCKAPFSLAKMDTSFDFDFDGGLNALSKFNVDMSDLDLPSSRDKSHRTKESSREKEPHDSNKRSESKFSFEFKGFDELDLDDTLKTKKEPQTPFQSKKGRRDLSPHSTASKCRKKGLLDSLSDNASESTSVPADGASMNKESQRTWSESARDQGKTLGEFAFSGNSAEDSAYALGHPLAEIQEQTSKNSDCWTPQKGRDTDIKASTTFPAQANSSGGNNSSTADYCSKGSDIEVSHAIIAEHSKAVSTTSQVFQEPDKNIGIERAALPEVNVAGSKKPSSGMELDGSSSECEMQNVPVDEEKIEEGNSTKMDVNESPQSRLSTKTSCSQNLMLGILEEPFKVENDEEQKSSACNLEFRQEASDDGHSLLKEEKVCTNHLYEEKTSTLHLHGAFHVPVGWTATNLRSQEAEVKGIDRLIASEPHTLSSEASPRRRPAKRKFSGEGRTLESPFPKQNSSKKLEADNISKGPALKEIFDSATSQQKCKDLHSSLVEKHQDAAPNPLLCRTAQKLVAGVASLKKTTMRPALQSPRPLLGNQVYHSNHQRQVSLVNGKSSMTRLQGITGSQTKPTAVGSSQSPSLPSLLQLNRSPFPQTSIKDVSSRTLPVRSRPSTEKQLQGMTLRRTSGLAVLSKTRVMGALRESCKKTFKLDLPTSNGVSAPPLTHSRKDLATLRTGGDGDEKNVLENSDMEMTDMQNIENCKKSCLDKETVQTNTAESLTAHVQNAETLKESSSKEMVQAMDDGSHLAVSLENDAGIIEKSEYYADQLDQLLRELKNKYEEAMDLRVRAMAVNNSLMMLNNPVDDEKIRKITYYLREKLRMDVQGPPMRQLS